MKKSITQEELRSALLYDPEAGIFTWLRISQFAHRVRVGDVAGYVHGGYIEIGVRGRYYKAHRLAWLYMTGEWPTPEVDHINGRPSDNRWVNLRLADRALNCQNIRSARKDNARGFLGVSQNGNGFQAALNANKRRYYLGTFPTEETAHAAYLAAKRRLHQGCTI